ncbi:MAG: PKD domain-containing protein [Candidatus Nitrosocosmicus sp.]|nr:PKD domain-containing protein [Candidatus Nitrosocosmicus sp.]MDN5866360.1 PKD domain-containing protein [Candidatus Nitrosocosmicus sp.]
MGKKTISHGLILILIFMITISNTFFGFEKAWTDSVISTIDVIETPSAIEYNPSNGDIYVASHIEDEYDLGHVFVIDGSTNTVIKTIEGGAWPDDLEYNPSNENIYVANFLNSSVSVIDSSTNMVIDTIPLRHSPSYLEYNPSNENIYVAGSSSVSIIDSSTNMVIDTVDVDPNPTAIEYNPSNGDIYVATYDSGAIFVIDSSTNTVIDTISVGDEPYMLEYNPSNDNIYVANQKSKDVSIISTTTPPIVKPVADAGPDQPVRSNDVVQLDGSNSSDPEGSPLTYSWTQLSGPEATLSDPFSSNPIFDAPEVNEQTDLTFQLIVTNEDGIVSEPDEVIVTVNPVTTPPPPNEEPRTNGDIIKGIIQNPLNITNSINSANEITDILTDDNPDNDQRACDLLDQVTDRNLGDMRDIIGC